MVMYRNQTYAVFPLDTYCNYAKEQLWSIRISIIHHYHCPRPEVT